MVERIKKILEKEDMVPSLFADRIGISRATMNHILNGRNNPSLDVVSKILIKFPEIGTEWLMFGKGPMYKGEKHFHQPHLFDDFAYKTETKPSKMPEEPRKIEKKPEEPRIKEPVSQPPVIKQPKIEEFRYEKSSAKIIEKIIIYFSDNTYENFIPE
ncbi:MAG: helix-turn-helix domain-containing protein [Dysgonamonadaceae bacterium]|jgi:transcriptional regulator with XRE-family HTH domain|nr:helix-turn-helix domain-containing protein [Dysgonamonadaceae bacterium]